MSLDVKKKLNMEKSFSCLKCPKVGEKLVSIFSGFRITLCTTYFLQSDPLKAIILCVTDEALNKPETLHSTRCGDGGFPTGEDLRE